MQLSANGIAIEAEVHGPETGEPLLLIMGLGMQLLGWPEGFVEQLVAAGFRVIRFDNRDVGLSEDCAGASTPMLGWQALRHWSGLGVHSPYGLADMAEDAVGVLDALDVDSAHVCGASMGGMIAQHLAARHPHRVRSMALLMTSSGAFGLPGPHWRVKAAALAKPASARDPELVVDHYRRFFRLIGSPAYPTDSDVLDDFVRRCVQRSYRPAGTARQLLALAADGDRSRLLKAIGAPTIVIHGDSDVMLPPASGLDLQRKIAGAELDLIAGMGHDLPPALWPRLVANICRVARQTAPA